jgi:hypothetical protein
MSVTCDLTEDPSIAESSPLASGSLRAHIARGAAGFGAAALSVALLSALGPISLLLLLFSVLAWRGCPTCWTVGLIGTIADERARRRCSRCRRLPGPDTRTGSP